ncbi:MAG: hypothetical protein AUJ51_03645 [Elusimicrobia bacterium CG1_02_56_21]|nr:MAG: hypothetical protein AUJ51_03645 [Elusimicrobia bacterium CG1_02_56_21]
MRFPYIILAGLVFLLAPPCLAPAQTVTGQRLDGLEDRIIKVEKRVTRLEGGAPQPAARAAQKEPVNPVTVSFLGKKQVVGQKRLGIKLYLEFENVTSRPFFAFNGTLVFRNKAGAVIWSRPYAHSEPLGSGERVEVSMGILSTQAKEYLKFIKARLVTVSLEDLETYSAE